MGISFNVGRLVLAFAFLCLLACGEDSGAEERRGGAQATVTFQRDVRPLVEQHCAGCHKPGGIGPFPLGYDPAEWESGAPSWAAPAVNAVLARRMPPWKPDPACRDLDHSRRLPDEALEVFSRWAEGGYALGDERDYVPPQMTNEPNLGEPSLVTRPDEAYTPRTDRADDYRCFLLPQTFAEERYLIGSNVVPGVLHEVHHVILYAIDESQVADAEALDAAEEGPGYTCYGSSRVSGATIMGAWVPGMVPNVTPKDSARVIGAGSRLVMQVHYNTSHTADQGVHPDRTSVELWLMEPGKQPTYRISTIPLANLDLNIEPGDANSVHTRVVAAPLTGTIVGALPHMHTLGKRIEVTLEQGDEEMCLVRIPDWDFHWQQGYRYREEAFVEVQRGDRLHLTCVYDNSQGSEVVHWGEGTDDEMCLNYLEIRTPFLGKTLESACPGYHDCIDGCSEGDALCIIQCGTGDASCQACVAGGLGRCAPGLCSVEGLALQSCLGDCAGDSDCARANCARESLTFFGCMEPHIRAGSCDSSLESCGL